MIYLTLDSNIWLNTLKESEKEENLIDILEYWISNGHVTILLPEIIITEWKRNRDNKKRVLLDDWKSFYNKAKKILGADVVREVLTPDSLNEIVENRLEKVDYILEYNAVKIPITTVHKLKAIELAEQKKAPYGAKNSTGDAFIYLAMIDYISANSLSNCVFITNNHTDFSSKESTDKIHPDLKPEFDKLSIEYYIDLKRFFHDYKHILPNASTYIAEKSLKEEDKKLTNAVLHPQTSDSLNNLRDSYIENINLLDLVIRSKNPTKEQVLFSFSLIDSDISYKKYFFKNLKNVIWFKLLKDQGYFDFRENPKREVNSEGTRYLFWYVLNYLENLSSQIDVIQEQDIIPEIYEIIEKVSKNPQDNPRTWYTFIMFLVALPNEIIPLKILNYIPIWLTSDYETVLQSSEICEKLLPKFLNDSPTNNDIDKAEIILNHIFTVHKHLIENTNGSYFSKISLYYLTIAVIPNKLITKISTHCSDDIIIYLANSTNKLLCDFSEKIIIQTKDDNIKLNINIIDNSIIISKIISDQENLSNDDKLIINYESRNEADLKNLIIKTLKDNNIEINESDFNEYNLSKVIENYLYGSQLYSHYEPIKSLDDEYNDSNLYKVFPSLFRDILYERILIKGESALPLLKQFVFNKNYKSPFFLKVVLFIISKTWETTKLVFLSLIDNNDENEIFSNYIYSTEVFDILERNHHLFTNDENILIQNIINSGPKKLIDESDNKYINHWKISWLYPVRSNSFFSKQYNDLTLSENVTGEPIRNGGMTVTTSIGYISPLNANEIIEKSNPEIVDYITNFKPKEWWEEGPTIEGLANALENAIENNPQKFVDELLIYSDLYYIYVYHIINGLRNAWSKKNLFDWENVLIFSKNYLNKEDFYSEKLSVDDNGWGANSDWIVGSISTLLTEGLKSDSHAFPLDLLPIAKEVVISLVSNIKKVEKTNIAKIGHINHTLNSTAGKVIRSLLDYCLRKARQSEYEHIIVKWESDIKDFFEDLLYKDIVDSYIAVGLYFRQFSYLDNFWINSKIKDFYNVKNENWHAFIEGYVYNNPSSSKEVNSLFYPHYERAISSVKELEKSSTNGIIRHLITFYIWGYEDINSESLLGKFINAVDSLLVIELINFLRRQVEYSETLKSEDLISFETKVLKLWNYINDTYKNNSDEESKNVLANLSGLFILFSNLSDTVVDLLIQSIKYLSKYMDLYFIIEKLMKLKDNNLSTDTPKYISTILISSSSLFNTYLSESNRITLIELITYLYENNQKNSADFLCDSISKIGYDFLFELYNKYNR